MELKNTVEMMLSDDYKERFRAEYYQLKIRLEKLSKFLVEQEAAAIREVYADQRTNSSGLDRTKVTPEYILRTQKEAMSQYKYQLEIRAVLEGIEL